MCLRTMEPFWIFFQISSEALQKHHAKTETETEQKRDRERGLEPSQINDRSVLNCIILVSTTWYIRYVTKWKWATTCMWSNLSVYKEPKWALPETYIRCQFFLDIPSPDFHPSGHTSVPVHSSCCFGNNLVYQQKLAEGKGCCRWIFYILIVILCLACY